MKVNLTPMVGRDSFWTEFIGRTFEVTQIGPDTVDLKPPKESGQKSADVPVSLFWDYFELANTQLEFDFNASI